MSAAKLFDVKPRLLVSVSGGRSSMYMLWWIWNNWHEKYDIKAVFANTGKEQIGTLIFVQQCSERWNIPITWVEYRPARKKGPAAKAQVVSFSTASRNGEPFRLLIERHGIPSTNAPFCSLYLKARTIRAYMRFIGWKKYYLAIGIRVDEPLRIAENHEQNNILYPLAFDQPMTKPHIGAWWKQQAFDLNIIEDLGNCDGCWKKNIRQLVRIAINTPEVFDWWHDITNEFGHFNPRKTKLVPPFNFYRGNMSPADILRIAQNPARQVELYKTDKLFSACGESCEGF